MSVYFDKALNVIPDNEKEKRLTGKVLCSECNGSGILENEKCKRCSGSGYHDAKWTWTISSREP